MTLTEDYLREVEAALQAEPQRRRQIVDELRGHLEEKMADARNREPERPPEEVEREVLRDFGSPHDLALAYGSGGPVLVNRAGETVLRVGQAVGRGASSAARAVGRGTGRFLKRAGIALAVLLVLGLASGVWAYYEFKPYVLAMVEEDQPVFLYAQSCHAAPCNVNATHQTFYVKPEARQVRFTIHLDGDTSRLLRLNATDDVRVAIADPHGNVRYERSGSLMDTGSIRQEFQWAAAPGNWTVSVSAVEMVGHVDMRAHVSSAPWHDLA